MFLEVTVNRFGRSRGLFLACAVANKAVLSFNVLLHKIVPILSGSSGFDNQLNLASPTFQERCTRMPDDSREKLLTSLIFVNWVGGRVAIFRSRTSYAYTPRTP